MSNPPVFPSRRPRTRFGGCSRPACRVVLSAEIARVKSFASPSTIYGNHQRGTGILNNELYIGRLVWNRLRYVKNPDTGKRVSRLNPESEWMSRSVLQLRIVPDEIWAAAKARQQHTRHAVKTAGVIGVAKRPRYLFSGLTKCGICGAGFIRVRPRTAGC